MVKVDFNVNFSGFQKNEDILVDTGVLLALLNEYDSWHKTVSNLFENFVFNNDDALFLYINPCIQNELTNLISNGKPLEWYGNKHSDFSVTQDEIDEIERKSIDALQMLIDNEILIILNSNKESSLQQLKLYKELGAADAINATLANEYGISFLTVDNKLVNNMICNADKLENIQNLYYTTPIHKTY